MMLSMKYPTRRVDTWKIDTGEDHYVVVCDYKERFDVSLRDLSIIELVNPLLVEEVIVGSSESGGVRVRAKIMFPERIYNRSYEEIRIITSRIEVSGQKRKRVSDETE